MSQKKPKDNGEGCGACSEPIQNTLVAFPQTIYVERTCEGEGGWRHALHRVCVQREASVNMRGN